MKLPIRTPNAPAPAAAYEQAVRSGDLIFVSGQIATNPVTGKVEAVSIEDQVTQTLLNIEAIVDAGGGTRNDIVRCGVFLADLKDFPSMNRAYQNFFGDALPARTTVQVGLGTILVEIDAIAVRSKKDHGRVKVRESATRRSSK